MRIVSYLEFLLVGNSYIFFFSSVSCWVFSSIGALEAAVRVAGGPALDLSEQQVLDCVNDRYGAIGREREDNEKRKREERKRKKEER